MAPLAILSGTTFHSDIVAVKVRNDGDHIETVRVYIDVIPPGGPSNPGGCLPDNTSRLMDSSVTLDPTGVTFPKQQNVFADTGTVGDGLVDFSCTNKSAVIGMTWTIIAAVDAHGDDSAACGPGLILTIACANALADDDTVSSNNRLTRSAPRVQPG